jgi:hypothetical protein
MPVRLNLNKMMKIMDLIDLMYGNNTFKLWARMHHLRT